eukprot:GHVP01061541.1.p1 GENE.GHVP01061541.1~~GHVP01061541.1.p1  ORF type:complete len:164 (+),score=20.14 GHVP01061541.1:22-492(+)
MDFLKKICDDAHTTLLVQDCPQDTCVIDDLLFIRYQKKEVVESFCSSTVSETESIGLTSESSLPSAPNLLLATRRQRRNGVSTGPRQRRMGCGAAPDPTFKIRRYVHKFDYRIRGQTISLFWLCYFFMQEDEIYKINPNLKIDGFDCVRVFLICVY